MAFIAENHTKGIFEPLVDRDRCWAMTIGWPDRDGRQSMVLYDLNDLSQIGVRDDTGHLVDLPAQRDIALCAITIVSHLRKATPAEKQLHPDSDEVIEFSMYGSPQDYATTPYIPGYNWEESKSIYREALIAQDQSDRQSASNPNIRILKFL